MARFSLLALMAAVLLAADTVAQEPVPAKLVIPVSVLEEGGQHVSGLSPLAFRATFRGRPVAVASVQEIRGEFKVTILVDTSKSMSGMKSKNLQEAFAGVAFLVRGLGNDHAVALLSVSDNVQVLVSSRKGVEEILNELRKVPVVAGGATALLDGIAAGIRVLQPVGFGDALVVISDGVDNGSRLSRTEFEQLVRSSGVRLFPVIHSQPNLNPGLRNDRDERERRRLRQDALDTGGVAFDSETYSINAKELNRLMQPLLSRLTSTYRVELAIPSTSDAQGKVKLEVVDEHGVRMKNVEPVYPRGLLSPKKASL